jgi:hypothetical protein
VEWAKILKGKAGIGGRMRKDILSETAVEEFLKWVEINRRPKALKSCRAHVNVNNPLGFSKGMKLSKIVSGNQSGTGHSSRFACDFRRAHPRVTEDGTRGEYQIRPNSEDSVG